MKISLLCLLTVLLSACYNIAFDPVEYDRYTTIKHQADISYDMCGTPAIAKSISNLKSMVDRQYIYSHYRSNRPQVAKAAEELKYMVDGMYNKYQNSTPSIVYCREKLVNISSGTSIILSEIGSFQ